MNIRNELEKMKKMNRKDLLWYIAEYYKFHILAIIIAVVLIYTGASTIYRMSFHDALHCIYINSRSEQSTNLEPLQADFAQWKQLGKKEQIKVETCFISYGENATEYSIANMEKIAALGMARELDVLICDTENLDHYAEAGSFLDLEQALPDELLKKIENRLYRITGPDGQKHAYAIDLSETSFAKDSILAQNPPLLGIVSNSRRTDTAIALIQYIFQ